MSEKNKITIEIFGQHYTLKGTASSSHMRLVAGYVDDKMTQLGEVNPKLDARKIAVLSAVNIADEYFRLKEEYEELLRIIEKQDS
jgi:cell division protein ZapA